MKIISTQEKLSKAVLKVQKAVSAKSSSIALEGIHMKTVGDKVQLCGYDLDLGITTTIPANIEQQGEIVLNAKILSEIVKKLPEGSVELSSNENFTTTITCGQSVFTIAGTTPDEYPELPKFDESMKIEIQSDKLKRMIKQTIFAIAETDAKPVHMGTLFDIKDNNITLASVDGYRFAMSSEKIAISEKNSFVVPGKTLNEILKLLPDEDEKLYISIGNRHIIFNIENCSIISRLLEGDFLDYKAALPATSSMKAKIKTKDLIEGVERVSLLIQDKLKSPVCCIFEDNMIELSCATSIGKATDKFICKYEGERVEIGFNSKYMLDALKNADSDEITIEMNGSLNPIKITPLEGESFIFLVLPVRLKASEN